MTRILLVGTVHEEQGLATISALHAILEHARPEVIFLEIPSAVFPSYDDGTRSNLESSAARRYREDNDVALVPVDLATPDESFFRDCKYLDRRIATTSPTYCRLIDQNSHDIATYGFPYLNSHQCSKAWSDIYEAMHTGIQRLSHDSRLSEIFAVWKHTNSLRDRAMLRSITSTTSVGRSRTACFSSVRHICSPFLRSREKGVAAAHHESPPSHLALLMRNSSCGTTCAPRGTGAKVFAGYADKFGT